MRMSYRSLLAASALLAVIFAVSACGSTPPPKTPDEDTTEAKTEPEPVKPPPECKSLEEKCKAEPSTTAKIKLGALTFKPAEGWIYAQGEESTVAQFSDDGAALIIGTYETDAKDAKKDATNRDATFDALLKTVGVTPPKAKVPWKKPQAPKEVGSLKLGLWEVGEVERAKKKGPLLVVQGNLPDGRALIAIGFAPTDQADSAEKIMASIDTLAPDAKAADDKGKDDKGEDDKGKDEKAGSGSK
jgi:hypothetical protein